MTSASLTNALTLGGDWQIGSRNLERHAVSEGYCERSERLNFKAAYSIPDWPEFLTDRRRESAKECLAEAPLDLARLKTWLRSHGREVLPPSTGREFTDPDRYSVCMHADATSMTTASLIVRLPEERAARPWPVWISFATPCTGVFIPVYLDGILPDSLARAKLEDGVSVWIEMRRLQAKSSLDFGRHLSLVQEGWRDFERVTELERERVEEEVAALYAQSEAEAGATLLTDFMSETTQRLLDTAKTLCQKIEAAA